MWHFTEVRVQTEPQMRLIWNVSGPLSLVIEILRIMTWIIFLKSSTIRKGSVEPLLKTHLWLGIFGHSKVRCSNLQRERLGYLVYHSSRRTVLCGLLDLFEERVRKQSLHSFTLQAKGVKRRKGTLPKNYILVNVSVTPETLALLRNRCR